MTVFDQDYLRRAESRCTQESPPHCRRDCPLDLDVRAFLDQAAQGKWSSARKILERHLPLPELFCRLCDHPCEEGCARRDLGGSLDVRGLEVFSLSALGPQLRSLPMPRKGKSIVVLGAGLAGLVAAWDLSAKGYAVTVLHAGTPEAVLCAHFSQQADVAGLWPAQQHLLERRGVRFVPLETEDDPLPDRLAARYDAVLLDAHALPELAPAEQDVEAATLHWQGKVCCAGWPVRSPTGHAYVSASRQAGQGRQAARSLERLATGVSLTAARDGDLRELHTRLDGIAPVERVEPAGQIYDEAEARREAERCLQCQCLICVKECVLLQKYKGYPRVYARQMFNNAAIVMGLHLANPLINGCTLCGQCEELCPENFSMAELCLQSRRDMVERGYMPPSAHEFALEDMEAACAPDCALCISPSMPAGGAAAAPDAASPGWLFFPGCQLTAARGEQVAALFRWLRESLAGTGELAPGLERGPVGLLARCCGIPARWAGREARFQALAEELRRLWEQCGRPRLLVACASCLAVVQGVLPQSRPLSLWELLDALPWPRGPQAEAPRRLSVQDPCTARHHAGWQRAVRSLAVKAGCQVEEPRLHGADTACCGYGGLVWCAQPETARAMTEDRAAGLAHTALTSCIMCRDRLVASGKESLHLLDLLPQLAGTAHPPATERGPGLSARRSGRFRLRQRLLEIFPLAGEAASLPQDLLPLEVAPALLDELEAHHILLTDVQEAVTRVERHRAYFVNETNGHRLGSWRPRRVTFWVEYTAADGRYVLHGAWCHRMHVPGSGCVDEPDGAPAACCGR